MCEIEQIYGNVDCYEAKDLLNEIKSGNSVFLMNDPEICMINGGHTIYGKDNEGFFTFSEGTNWRDQEKSYYTKEDILGLLQEALSLVEADFDKYGYDTKDTNACYITIDTKEEAD